MIGWHQQEIVLDSYDTGHTRLHFSQYDHLQLLLLQLLGCVLECCSVQGHFCGSCGCDFGTQVVSCHPCVLAFPNSSWQLSILHPTLINIDFNTKEGCGALQDLLL